MKFFAIIIISFALYNTVFALDKSNQCSKFNSVALQLSLAQPGMQSPLNLEQLQNALGYKKPTSTSTLTTHTWTCKNRILLVKAINGDLTTKLLTGNDDGSLMSKKMEQLYERLKSATSIWIIKEIQQQLGPGNTTNSTLQKYNWHCGIGSLEIIADKNNITAATIEYNSSQNKEAIEAIVGFNHPEWDIKEDSFGKSYRAWKRSF